VRHANLPHHLYVNVLNSFLGPGMPEGHTRGIWHGVYTRLGQMVMCHVLLETGAHWSGLPLHALTTGPEWASQPDEVMPWFAMGDHVEVWRAEYLEGLLGRTRKHNHEVRHTGMMIDWADGFSRYPEEHKPLNLVVDTTKGSFFLLPNNHIVLNDKHFVNEASKVNLPLYRRGEKVYWED